MSQASVVSKPIDKYIPWMIVAFFVVIIAVNAVFVTIAIKTRPGIVTEEAYEKGLAYNQTLDDAAKQAALGWHGTIAYTSGNLTYTLTDKAGAAITGAAVSADIRRPVGDTYDTTAVLNDAGNGLYQSKMDFPLKGLWQVRVNSTKDGQPFQTEATLTIQ